MDEQKMQLISQWLEGVNKFSEGYVEKTKPPVKIFNETTPVVMEGDVPENIMDLVQKVQSFMEAVENTIPLGEESNDAVDQLQAIFDLHTQPEAPTED